MPSPRIPTEEELRAAGVTKGKAKRKPKVTALDGPPPGPPPPPPPPPPSPPDFDPDNGPH